MADAFFSSPDAIQRFIDTEDHSLLEKPIVFDKNKAFNHYQCCLGALAGVTSMGITALFCPLATCCPCTMYKDYGLKLTKDSVVLQTAANDFCCHVAHSLKTVPLDKVQDVELTNNCIQTCYGVQQVNVQTAGQSGTEGAEVMAAFLRNPAQVREAIQLAVKLHKEGATSAPGQAMMSRSGGASGPSTMLQRLRCLEGLVGRGVLTPAEAASMRVAVLAADKDPLVRLVEAADLFDKRLISDSEFIALKANLLAQILPLSGAAVAPAGGPSTAPQGWV